ncbi:hypothetical protein ACSBR1_042822 [Camellia fascicularis]
MGRDLVFFIFESPECYSVVLEGGPWYIGGFNLFLKKWTRMMKLTKEKATTVPVWAKFYNVSFEYWDSDGLSHIASAVGVPLFMDQLTEKGSRVSFARVCVEVEATSYLPSMFKVNCEGEDVVVKVEYQGLRPKCEHCIVFGHDTSKCVKTQVAALVNLQKETENNPDPGWETVMAKGKRKVGGPDMPSVSETHKEPKDDGLQNSEVEASQPKVPAQVESEGSQSSLHHRVGPNLEDGELQLSNLDGLEALQRELVEITRLALPNDVELRAKVENLVGSTPSKDNLANKLVHTGTSSKGNSSGKGNKSQRKKHRGFNNPHRHKEIRKFLLHEDIKILGILETKIKAVNENQASAQHIFCEVHDLSNDNMFRACFVYADNIHDIRKVLFEHMVTISHSQSKNPLIFWGDFNAIRFPHEKFGGSGNWSKDKEDFNSCILQSNLVDLSYGGCQFTWANKRSEGDYIATKIDRVLVNEAWLDAFPASLATFLPSGISDHSPAVVNLSGVVTSFKKPFKYFDFWADHENFGPVVSSVWHQYIQGVPMFRVCQKLKNLKLVLKALNKKNFSDISTRVQASNSELLSAQGKLDKDPSNVKEANFEWCEFLYCGPSDLCTYNECFVSILSSRCTYMCCQISYMAAFTGFIIMFDHYFGCMGGRSWFSLGGCCFDVILISSYLDVRVDWFSVMAATSAYWMHIVASSELEVKVRENKRL